MNNIKKFVKVGYVKRPGNRYQKKLNKKQKTQVKRLINIRQELKFFAFTNVAFNVTTTPTINNVAFTIPQNDTDQSRDGDRLMWCGTINIRMFFQIGQGATGDVYNRIRYIVFQWKPNSVPVIGNILLPGPSTTQDVYSQYSHDFRQEYKILYDTTVMLVGNNSSTTNPYQSNMVAQRLIKIPTKKINKQVQYSAGGTTGTNLIYHIFISDSSLATHPTATYTSKIFFRDG